MLKKISHLLKLIWPFYKGRILRIQSLMILNAILELAGVISIIPFMSIVVYPSFFEKSEWIQKIYLFFGFSTKREFVLALGLCTFGIVALANLVSALTLIRVQSFAMDLGQFLSSSLFSYYVKKDYFYHVSHRSSLLIKNTLQECNRLTNYVIVPFLQSNIQVIILVFVLVGLVVVKPIVAAMLLGLLGGSFYLIYRFFMRYLDRNSHFISSTGQSQYLAVTQGFAGIKIIKLFNAEYLFTRAFKKATSDMNSAMLNNFALTSIPGNIVQVLVFGGISLFVVGIFYFENIQPEMVTSAFFFVVAGYKIFPSVRQIFANVSMTKGHIAAYDEVIENLEAALTESNIEQSDRAVEKLSFQKEIRFKDVSFSYLGRQQVLHSINLEIKKGAIVGLAGPSGGGKTTLVDILTGLLSPSSGNILIDGKPMEQEDLERWRMNCSYVPQSTYFIDGTISENITFGSPETLEGYDARVIKSLQAAKSYEFVSTIPLGIHGDIGEAGKKLSGGQRQRIGIARALFREADLLVLDEATSSLDGALEQGIMRELLSQDQHQTIVIVAHRLQTLKKCDVIYFINEGKVADAGNYDQLFNGNELFRKMAYGLEYV